MNWKPLDRRTLLRRGLVLMGAAAIPTPRPSALTPAQAPARGRLRLLAHVELEPRQT